MNQLTILAAVVVGLLALYWYSTQYSRPDFGSPPDGFLIENRAELEKSWQPGQTWPTKNPCAGTGLPYHLITPLCTGGNAPGLINNGGGKCTNATSTAWTGCVNATA